MRALHVVLALAALGLASGMAACASISGLSDFASEDCPATGCKDGAAHPHVDGQATDDGAADDGTTVDATTEGALTDDATEDTTAPDDAAEDSTNDAAPPPDGGADATPGDAAPVDAGDSGPTRSDAAAPCPDGGCPTSTATAFSSCPFGSCNGSTGSACSAGGGCLCIKDSQCLSGKCVKVTGENDLSCGSNCTGSGSRDGFDCQLASPGIPAPTGTAVYSCPAGSGYQARTLTCDSTHTNCYCNADNQCTSGKCVPSAANNASCGAPAGPCTGSGTPDYRGCVPMAAIPNCPIYIGCPPNTGCQYPICYCTSDAACESGHCIPSSHNGNCGGCTGTGSTDDGHGCMPAPSSVACGSTGSGTACTTTLIPTPVLNTAKTACLCVADSDCSTGKCVNANTQCTTGPCTGTGSHDSEDCQTGTSIATAWSCSEGNCQDVSSASGTCTAAGVPCLCISDTQCDSESRCANWPGCASGACTGTTTGTVRNAFNCVQ